MMVTLKQGFLKRTLMTRINMVMRT